MQDIPVDQILRRLARENPWWREPFTIPQVFAQWRPRPYLEPFYPLVRSRSVRRALVLMGPRQVGKTVLLHHAVQRLIQEGVEPRRIGYISVDSPLYNGLSLERLIELYGEATGIDFQSQESYLFLDEIQYLKNWEVHLKTAVDGYPAGKIIASGSAAAALRLKSQESGAGRFTEFHLPPLTFYEYLTLRDQEGLIEVQEATWLPNSPDLEELNRSFVHYLNFGGFPEVVLSPEIQGDLERFVKNDIVDKVLLRDLPSLYGIQDVQELNSLFTTLAFNTAQEVSLEELASRSGVAKGTLKRYVEYLEAAFLIRIVHRVDRSARRFQRANFFKVYLTNPSIRSALFAPIGDDDPGMGALVETAIFAQWFHTNETLHYARWRNGELDVVRLDKLQKVSAAIEVKWTDRPVRRPDELKEAIGFCRAHKLPVLAITTRTARAEQDLGDLRLHFMPAALYCFGVGYYAVRGLQEGSLSPWSNGAPTTGEPAGA